MCVRSCRITYTELIRIAEYNATLFWLFGLIDIQRTKIQHIRKLLHFCPGCIMRAVIVLEHLFCSVLLVQTSTIVSKVGSLKSQIQKLFRRPSHFSFLQAHTNGVVV